MRSFLCCCLVLSGLSFALPSPAVAFGNMKGKSMESAAGWFFDQQDKNKDGILTQEERNQSANRDILAKFSKLDLNGDGQLTRDEYIEAFKSLHSGVRTEEV